MRRNAPHCRVQGCNPEDVTHISVEPCNGVDRDADLSNCFSLNILIDHDPGVPLSTIQTTI